MGTASDLVSIPHTYHPITLLAAELCRVKLEPLDPTVVYTLSVNLFNLIFFYAASP